MIFFFFLSAHCGQRLLVEYEKSTERNTGSSIHGEKQQMGKKKAQKTAILLLNAQIFTQIVRSFHYTPGTYKSRLEFTKENDNTPIRGESFRHKQLTVKCLGTGPFPAQHSVAEARVRKGKKRRGGWIPR